MRAILKRLIIPYLKVDSETTARDLIQYFIDSLNIQEPRDNFQLCEKLVQAHNHNPHLWCFWNESYIHSRFKTNHEDYYIEHYRRLFDNEKPLPLLLFWSQNGLFKK